MRTPYTLYTRDVRTPRVLLPVRESRESRGRVALVALRASRWTEGACCLARRVAVGSVYLLRRSGQEAQPMAA